MAILAIGIFVQLETENNEVFEGLGLDNFFTNPAVILIVIGAVLFLLGFTGCFGALFEIFYVLVFVSHC